MLFLKTKIKLSYSPSNPDLWRTDSGAAALHAGELRRGLQRAVFPEARPGPLSLNLMGNFQSRRRPQARDWTSDIDKLFTQERNVGVADESDFSRADCQPES